MSPQTDSKNDAAEKRASERAFADGESERESATTSVLHAENLSLGYPDTDEPVVECDRIDVPEGEITALVGPNGSGKSTLLKALSNHLQPESGSVILDGREIHRYDDTELACELGLLSQENDAPASITVEDLAYHGRYPHRGFFDSVTDEDCDAVDRAIDLAGVEDIRDEEVGNLSGGQKQLAWIAMVLAQDTDVLLLDEPTTFLDLHHQLRVMEVVRTLNEKEDVTVAVVLHDIAQAARFADNLVALDDGEPYDWGPPREVVTEQLLADVFEVDAAVTYTPDPEIVPKRSL
jgi:iron complex transport system ATP-binding protein